MNTTPPLVSTPSEKNLQKQKEWASSTQSLQDSCLIMNFSHCFLKKTSVLAHTTYSANVADVS